MFNKTKYRFSLRKTLTLFVFLIFVSSNSLHAQWYAIDSAVGEGWESIFFTDANTGYAAGYKYTPTHYVSLIKTTNAGTSWYPMAVPLQDTSEGLVFRSVFFTNNNTGYVAGGSYTYPTVTGMVLKTTNGGESWFNLILPIYRLFDYVYFINQNTGYVSGYQYLLRTRNGGLNWDFQFIYSGYQFQIRFTDSNTGYVIGNNGAIFKTTNGGDSWFQQNSGTGENLFGLDFADANTGIAVGGNPVIALRTTNGGNNWDPMNISSSCFLWRARFITPTVGYILSICNQIFKTTDAGTSWCEQTLSQPVLCNFRDCFFTSIDTGYLAGSNAYPGWQGYILKTTDGGGNCITTGIEPVVKEIPEKFQLYQNYPNPFNPTTKIRYSLPKAGIVKLVVFDVLGREVATLVNEFRQTGNWVTEFNASNLPSGVYFYKLTTAEYTSTKKMLLIK